MNIISRDLASDLAENEDARNTFLGAQLRSFLTTQIRTIRTQRGLSQEELAEILGTSQSTIARLENREYGKFSLTTLLELAKAFDVALVVEFVEFPDFLIRTTDMSSRALERNRFSRAAVENLCVGTSQVLFARSCSKPTISSAMTITSGVRMSQRERVVLESVLPPIKFPWAKDYYVSDAATHQKVMVQ